MNSRTVSFIGLASENDLRIALNYKDAFEVLYESDKYQDQIIIPALFLVRQFLELGLKHNIRILSAHSGSSNLLTDLSKTHDLEKLHNSFLDHYKNTKKNNNINSLQDAKLLDDLKSLVNLINPLDCNSMGFRYSDDKHGKKQIPLAETFSLAKVHTLLDTTSNLISGTEYVLGL